jgi:sensor histidine kinase YesM
MEGGAVSSQSFGLFYVARRMRLCYGNSQRLTIESTEGQGTSVTLILPLHSSDNTLAT